jgi:outer membrane protein TolC
MKRRWVGVVAVLPVVFANAPARAQAPAPAPDHGTQALTIQQALDLALSRNERAKIADQQISVAEAAVETARTRFLPTLVATANDTEKTTQPNNAVTGAVTLTQPLLNAGAFPLLRQSQRLLDAQRATSADAKLILSYDAATAFFQTLTVQKVYDAALRRKHNADDDLENSQKLNAAGIEGHGANDVTRSLLEQATAQQEVATDTGNVQRAYLSLSFVLNAPVTGSLEEPTSLLAAATAPLARPEQLIALAQDRRLDLVASRHQAHAAHLFADEPLMRTVPTVSLVGSMSGTQNVTSGPTGGGAGAVGGITGASNVESVAVTMTWTLYDAGQRYADKHSRDAQAAIADLQEQTLVRSVANDVLNALNNLATAKAQLAASQAAYQQSQTNYTQTDTLYNNGLVSKLEQTTALDSLFESEASFIETQLAVELAYLALRAAMGLQPLGTELR